MTVSIHDDARRCLRSVVHIVDIPFVSRPPGFSSQEINYLKDPSVPRATVRSPLPPRGRLTARHGAHAKNETLAWIPPIPIVTFLEYKYYL